MKNIHNIHFSWQNWASRCENPALNALPRAQFLPQRKLHLRVPHTAASWGTPASPLGTVAFQKYRSEPELLITLHLLGISKCSEIQGNTLDKPSCILHPRKSFMHWHGSLGGLARAVSPEWPSTAMGFSSLEFSWAELSVFNLPRQTFRLSSHIPGKQSVQFAPVWHNHRLSQCLEQFN